MNDYVSQMTSGRGSLSNYTAEGFSKCLDRYCSMILANARNSLKMLINKLFGTQSWRGPRVTYAPCPGDMFIRRSFKDINRYISGINNPWAFDMEVRNEQQRKLEEEKEIQRTRAIAYQGFTGTTGADGKTTTYPGSLTKDNAANAQNVGNIAVGSAQDVQGVISSVVMAALAKTQQGFSGAQRSAQKDASTQSRVDSSTANQVDESGPGSLY
jgi:hypothetical protein